MRRKLLLFLCILLFLSGLGIFLWPTVQTLLFQRQSAQVIADFRSRAEDAQELKRGDPVTVPVETTEPEQTQQEPGPTRTPATQPQIPDYPGLLAEMERYNRTLYLTGQAGLQDAWSYEQAALDLTQWGLEDSAVGYITIPAMDLEMPLYLGASRGHMAEGAAVLGQTSLPIGGRDTNCVVAGHRGYRGAPYFLEIEKLEVGDEVYLTNFWQTLRYTVREIVIILPNEVDQVLIREGQDLVTLVTCHPYQVSSHRYVVYCQRDELNAQENLTSVPTSASVSPPTDHRMPSGTGPTGAEVASSQGKIQMERMLRYMSAGFILIILLALGICRFRRRKTKGS